MHIQLPPSGPVAATATADASAQAANRLRQSLLVRAMRQAHDRAQVAELRGELQRRDATLATAAHELRNCLTAMCNSVELMQRGTDDAARAVAGAIARRQLRTMTSLVQDLLDVGRIACDQFTLARELVLLQDVIRAAIEDCRGKLAERHLALSCSLPREPLWIEGDATRLLQVFTNLLGNAAKFTPADGHVHVAAASDGALARIEVEDDGVGIAPDELDRIFGLFQQERRTATGAAGGGLGIGLAVVRRLVELHGGTVQAHSRGADQGSTFSVRLPLARA